MSEVLEVGPRRTLPVWLLPVVALVLGGWAVLAASPPTVDGHGSTRPEPARVQYQPVLGRPIF